MRIHKNVVVNFIGGVWLGLLIVATTPLYVAELGLEGFGLVGMWQLLFYVALIFDLGLGAACVRELARSQGLAQAGGRSRSLISLFEKPVIGIGIVLATVIAGGSAWFATSWLNVQSHSADEVTRIVRLMAVSIALQFVTAFYLNALNGMQRMLSMNLIQIANNSIKYLGGAVVLSFGDGILAFFQFQVGAALLGLVLARWTAVRAAAPAADAPGDAEKPARLRQFMRFSGGMFVTAAAGALMTNADRLTVSRLLDGQALGQYTVALTIIGLLQTVVFAFHRAYYPRFSELSAAGDMEHLRRVYYDACSQVGHVIVPVGVLFSAFAPEIFMVWLGWSDPATVTVSRWLVLAFVLSGVMWLPAAYQQAIGWTRLHATVMLGTLAVGVPAMILAVYRLGLPGATALALIHGVIEITVGLWVMNRVCFPGETWRWYRQVLGAPLLAAAPLVGLSGALMPEGLGRPAMAAWIAATGLLLAAVLWAWNRHRMHAPH